MAFRSRHCFAGMVTKNHGAGPFQNQIVPLNSMFIGTAHITAQRIGQPLVFRRSPRLPNTYAAPRLVLLGARQPSAHVWLMIVMEMVKQFASREALIAQPHQVVFSAR
jgi:hypothetical protein